LSSAATITKMTNFNSTIFEYLIWPTNIMFIDEMILKKQNFQNKQMKTFCSTFS